MKNLKLKELKEHNKKLADIIKRLNHFDRTTPTWDKCTEEQKQKFRDIRAEYQGEFGLRYWNFSRIYRHYHIAYCLLRGREYKQIENKVKLNGKEGPVWSIIEEIMEKYNEQPKNVCASEEGSDSLATSGTSRSCISSIFNKLLG